MSPAVAYPMLASLTEEERRALLASARRRRFAGKEVIFHEGDPGDAVHLVAKGHVAIRSTTPLGDVATFTVLGPGDHFGELVVLNPAPRSATAVALDAVETLSITGAQLDELRTAHPRLDRFLLDALAGTVRRLSVQLSDALYVPVETRLYRRVLELTGVFGQDDRPATEIPVTQETLAELAGTTRPTANRALRAAEDAGAVVISRGRLTVLDRAWLEHKAR